jgi:hypothetical protein
MNIPVVFEQNCDPTLLAGIFGVGGTIVGAALAWIGNYFVARHNADAATAEAKRKESLELKAAARLVAASFSDGASLIQTIQEKGNWVFFVVELSMSPWKEYAPILSRAVTPEEFLPIYQAANGLRAFIEFHQVVQAEIQAGKIDGSVEVSSLTFMSGMKQKLEEATVILVRLAETQKV